MGYFVVVEGLEGSGKSTALETIKQCLEPVVSELVITREPGGTKLGEVVRTLLKTNFKDEVLDARAELLLFYAARVQLVEQVIRPALNRGAWVLADRFELSTHAYQGGGRGLDEAMIQQLSSFCLNGLQPDLTLFLDVSPKTGLNRAKARGSLDRIEQEHEDFFDAVHAAYHRQLKNRNNVVLIHAEEPITEVQKQLTSVMRKFMEQCGESLN